MNDLSLDRRRVLGLIGAGSAAALPGCATTAPAGPPVRFAHGVASGDPAADGAVLWTRVSTADASAADVPVRWLVSAAPGGRGLASGRAVARASADHTLKVEVDGLEPGTEYYYRFEGPGGAASPEGRFRTLPVGQTDRVVLAFASCQLYPGGFFNAYADMARAVRLDAVLMLGDYIYEYGADGYGSDIGQRIGRLPDPPHETVTLADYRRRHAQVKADPDMQAAHARAAFICVWDDHEVTNDGWLGGAENHQSQAEGDWHARKAAAMQAYFEWMPIRDPARGAAQEAIYRSFEFGDLATLAMLETRLLVRDRQLVVEGDPGDPATFTRLLTDLRREERELVGQEQRAWLAKVLTASVQGRKPWQIVGNQTVMARVAGPDLERQMGAAAYRALLQRLPGTWASRVREALAGYRAGVPFNLDAWDGYPGARRRMHEVYLRSGSRPLMLAGDSHAGWANNIGDDAGQLVAIEAGCTAITSPSYGALMPGIGRLIEQANSEVAYCNQDLKGYGRLTLTPDAARTEFVTVSTVTEREFAARVDAAFIARPGRAGGPWMPA